MHSSRADSVPVDAPRPVAQALSSRAGHAPSALAQHIVDELDGTAAARAGEAGAEILKRARGVVLREWPARMMRDAQGRRCGSAGERPPVFCLSQKSQPSPLQCLLLTQQQ